MKIGVTTILLLLSKTICFSQHNYITENLIGTITSDLNQEQISFEAVINKKKQQHLLKIMNGKEIIELGPEKIKNDSLRFQFKNYNSSIVLKATENGYQGYWINHHDNQPRKRNIDFKIVEEFPIQNKLRLEGNWKTELITAKKIRSGIAVFYTENKKNIGTIRTETGDYGYLTSIQTLSNSAYNFTSFDGNNAYSVQFAQTSENKYEGKLYTAKSTDYTTIKLYKEDSYELNDPNTLTQVINKQPFNLNLKDEKGNPIDFYKKIKNKVSIVTIFGTWCPNCIDETNFLKEISTTYPSKKLAIIHVAFENGISELVRSEKVERFKKKKELTSTFLIAGNPTKENVLFHFPMIDNFRSYPTLFLIDKKGEIVAIHTGFNGPATGIVYDQFKNEFKLTIDKLLK